MPVLVSHRVVISVPVYNEGQFIRETLLSLMEQRFTDFRVLVSDNASTDETESICTSLCDADPRFTYVRHEENLGAAENFRFCVESTQSDYFMWLGGHDVLSPEFLVHAVAKMDADRRISLVYGHTKWVDEQGAVLGYSNGGNYVFSEPLRAADRYLALLNALDRCEAINQLIRREFLNFEIRPVVSGDLVWLCHLAGHGPFARLEQPLYYRREFTHRTTTPVERVAGSGAKADYGALSRAFQDDIGAHTGIDASDKAFLSRKVSQWLHKRFGVPLPGETDQLPEPQFQGGGAVRPMFSVVMPVYNRERYVREAIDSVLSQGDGDFELIVVDDGSTDRSLEIIESIDDPRLRVIRNDHAGGAAARNTGIDAANGEFIVWIDSDDRQAPGALAMLRQTIQQYQDADVYYGDLDIFDEAQPGQVWHTTYPDYYDSSLLPHLICGNCLPNPGTAVRRSLYQRHGHYDVAFTRCHDFQMWTRLADSASFKKVDATLCHWRQHGESLSSAKTCLFEAKVTLDMFARYPVSRLFPGLSDDLQGQGEALWRVARILEGLQEHSLALRTAYQALALSGGERERIAELERLAGSHYEPMFTVILTTFNRPTLLRDALSSLAKQRFCDFDAVLVNDHGEPVEPLLAECPFPITYVRQGRNQGPAAARNAALRLARGRYIVYLDDDDIFLPDHLQTLAQGIEVHPGDVVYTDAVFIAEKLDNDVRQQLSEERRYEHVEFSRERLLVDNYIPVNTFAWPRAIASDVGEFDEALSGLEDWDFLMRLAARVPFHHVVGETVQVRMRVSEGAADRRSQQAFKDYPALYRELYSRHSDLGEANVRQRRSAKLKQLGLSPKLSPGEQVRAWLEARRPTPLQRELIEERLQAHHGGPRIGVLVLDMTGDADAIARTVASLQSDQQGYANVAIRVLSIGGFAPDRFAADNLPSVTRIVPDDHVESLNAAVAELDCEWCLLTRAGETFTASGLLITAVELIEAPACRAVYADEMQRSGSGDPEPVLRPDFNLDLLLSFPASMARHWLFRRDVLIEAGGFDGRYKGALEFELVLRLIELGGVAGLGHVSEPLIMGEALLLQDNPDEHKAIERHLMARGYAQPVVESFQPGRYRLRYGHAEQPAVSILIPARSPLSTLQRCLESLLETNRYANYEILLLEMVEQGSEVQAWLKALQGMGESTLRVLDYPDALTLGAVRNRAAQDARGEYLLFLDPDTAVVQEDWLHGLLNHAQRPEVGIVGAKLLGPEGHIRHAGLILGLQGPVGLPFVGEALGSSGYMHRLEVDQNYSAVSADCLMIKRSVFEQVGGWDESESAARWADVDLCLKAREAGYLTVWSPHVRLMKQGMRERLSTDEQDALFSRWLPTLARDPAYNPGFSLQAEPGFELAAVALAWRPLQAWRPLPTVLAHPADLAGCGQYRVIQPFNALQEEGFIEGALSFGMLSVVDLERYDPDVVLLQRQIGDERLEAMRRMQAFSRAFKVYELDDYLPNLPMKSAYRAHMPKDILRSLRLGISYVDRFVVSTEAMAEAFQDFHPDIRVIENRLDPRQWHGLTSQRRCSSKPRVGWAGGAGHTGDLEMLTDVVKALASEVEWVFFGMCPDKLRPFIHELHPGVPIEQYPAVLAGLNLDLALAPVEQNLFNECKSNLRLLEYGACGFPVICSDVRCYRDALPVTRVKNRFKDWLDAIRLHLADLDASARMGDELRAAVRNEWMLEGKNLEAWRKVWLPD